MILFIVFLVLSMRMHRLIFNMHNKGTIPEICTTSERYEGYPAYPWKVYLKPQDHISACTKLAACDGRGEKTPALFSPLLWQYIPLSGACTASVDFVHAWWMLKQARRRGQESMARNREGRLGPWWPEVASVLATVVETNLPCGKSETLSEALQSSYPISGALNHLPEIHFSLHWL